MTRDARDLTEALKAANPIPEPATADSLDETAVGIRDRIIASSPPVDAEARPPQRRVLRTLGAVLVGIAIGALTTAFITTSESSARPTADATSLSTISTQGQPVALTPLSMRILHATRADPRTSRPDPTMHQPTGAVFLMAQRGATAFLRVALEGGSNSYHTGRLARDGTRYELGSGGDWTPDPRQPIRDWSPIQAAGPGGFLVMAIQGFAADGVASVAVTDPHGEVVAEAAVVDNVYKITAYPPDAATQLIAKDEGQHVVYRWKYR